MLPNAMDKNQVSLKCTERIHCQILGDGRPFEYSLLSLFSEPVPNTTVFPPQSTRAQPKWKFQFKVVFTFHACSQAGALSEQKGGS